MKNPKKRKSILDSVETLFHKEEQNIITNEKWLLFKRASQSLCKSAHKAALPFDYKFNAVHWAFTVDSLCREIVYSYCWMKAFAGFYKEKIKRNTQMAHVDFHVSYYADNCITRIDSCRDKLALMVWAFYCPFNPEKKPETLNFEGVMERLLYPAKFALSLKNQNAFISQLQMLNGPDFQRVERYRHLKIHRIEPRIEMYGVKSHHGWDYMFPLFSEKDIRRWNQKLKKEYPGENLREIVKNGCNIDGVFFETRIIKDNIWDYSKVEKHIKTCIEKLLEATGNCFKILRVRSPLRTKRKA